MKNSSELGKFNSTGVLIFAFNTGTVDYVALADQTSRLTQKFLNLPITLITDFSANPKFTYDKIIRIESQTGNFRSTDDSSRTIEWKNFGRYLAYELSPYDTTILLDGDYLVLDTSLLTLLNTNFDYKLMHNSYTPDKPMDQTMGHYSLPFVWATVVLFKRSKLTKQYFDLIGRIQRNYSYYKTLYGGTGPYRNDYAFAIANLILKGYNLDQTKSIPWSMLTIEKPVENLSIDKNFIFLRHENTAHVISQQNIHIMDKQFLLSEKFANFVNKVCNAT